MMSVAETRAFFNARANGWSERCWQGRDARDAGAVERGLRRFLSPLPIRESDALLDVGCGDGVLVPHLLPRLGPDGLLVELDVAEKMIECNRQRHRDPRLRFIVADVADCALAPASFDGILCFSCFPHFPDPRETLAVLAILLRPHGWLAVCHLNSSTEMNEIHAGADPAVHADRLPCAPALAAMFAEAGLHVSQAVDEPGFYLVFGSPV